MTVDDARNAAEAVYRGEAGRRLARNSERHLKTAAQMHKLFADLPEAIANTARIAARGTRRIVRSGAIRWATRPRADSSRNREDACP